MMNRYQVRPSPSSWAVRLVPAAIPHIDLYLLAFRWIVLLGVSVIILGPGTVSTAEEQYGLAFIKPTTALPVVIGFNLFLSLMIWQRQPLATGRGGWLLAVDVLQAILVTALTGGLGSSFFILFPLTTIEVAMALEWHTAFVITVGLAALHAVLVGLNPGFRWESLPVVILVAKSFVLLALGGLVTLFSNQLQQETSGRRQAALAAARTTALNEIFLRLADGSLEPDQVLGTILNGVRILPPVAFSLVLLPDAPPDLWRVAASTTGRHPRGEIVAGMNWQQFDQPLFVVGAGAPAPLPDFVAGHEVVRLDCARLTSPGGKPLGLIVLGRPDDRPLSEEDRAFLHTLAMEAGLALRNANLYAREQAQVARLRQFEERQSVFFSAIGHELKTPLTVLKTLTPALQQWPALPPETQTEITETIEQNLARLEALITDLLEGSRLEANAIALHQRPVDLARRVRRVLRGMAPLLERKQQQVSLTVAPDLPQVWADGRRVEQIVSNLMNNAAKFGPARSLIGVELLNRGAEVQFCVMDAGPGVPPAERDRIFDKFYIAAPDKALAGVGLGLFICRELVRLHNGRIWLEARPEGGSRFCFTLPVAAKDAENENNSSQNFDHR